MGIQSIEPIHFETPVKPMLPRYILKTKYGQDNDDEVNCPPEPGSEAVSIPARRYGEAEIKNWPALSYAKPQTTDAADAHDKEELPWKLVSCPLVNTKGASLVPFTYNEAENKSSALSRRCVLANRHIPQDVSVYYVEMEGRALDRACIGLVKFRVKHKKQNNTTVLNSVYKNGLNTNGNGPSVLDLLNPARLNNGTANHRGVRNGNPFLRSEEAENGDEEDGNENNGVAMQREYFDEDVINDSEYDMDDDDDDNYRQDEDDEDDGEEDDDDDDADAGEEEEEEEEEEIDDDEEDDEEEDGGGYGHSFHFHSHLKFPPLTAFYDHDCGRNVDDFVLSKEKGPVLEPYCTWDLEMGNMFIEKTVFFSTSAQAPFSGPARRSAQPSNRIGMLVDFASRKVMFTVNGEMLDQSLNMIEENEQGGETEFFPFFAFPNGRITVHFGDSRLPNDGFQFNIAEYMNNLPQSFAANEHDVKKFAPTEDLIREYFEYYGYAEVLGDNVSERVLRRQQIRKLIEQGNISAVKTLVRYEYLPKNVQLSLDFAEYVQCARSLEEFDSRDQRQDRTSSAKQKARLAEALKMGKRLLAATKGNTFMQENVREASGILVTREPRLPELTRHYDETATTKLVDLVFRAMQKDNGPPPTLKVLGDTASQLSKEYPVGNRRAAQAVAVLRDICDGEIWRW